MASDSSPVHAGEKTKNYLVLFLPVVVVLIASGLRLYHLDAQSLWSDEIYEAGIAHQSLATILSELGVSSTLSMLFAHFSILVGDGDWFVRLPYAMAGILGVAVSYPVGKNLFGAKTGLVGAVLFSVSAFHIAYSQEARGYTFIVLFALLSLYCLLCALQSNKWRYWIGFAIVTALSLDNNVITVFVFASEVLFASLVLLTSKLDGQARKKIYDHWQEFSFGRVKFALTRARRIPTFREIVSLRETRLVVSVLLGLILFLPSSVGWLSYLAKIGASPAALSSSSSNRVALQLSAENIEEFLAEYGAGSGAALYLFVGAFVVGLIGEAVRRNWTQILLVALWIAIPFLLLGLVRTTETRFHLRHLIFVLPIFLLVVARGLVNIGEFAGYVQARIGHRSRLYAKSISIVLLVILFGWFGANATQAYYATQKEDWRGVSGFLRERAKSGDLVFQLSLWPRDGIPYYLDGYLSQVGVGYFDIFDTAKLNEERFPKDIWWVVRTEPFEGSLHPEKFSQLRTLLGPEFDIYPFARIALAHQSAPLVNQSEFLRIAKLLLSQEQDFDIETVQASYAWAWIALGDAEYALGSFDQAAESYSRGTKANPGIDDGYLLLANARRKQNRLDEAVRLYEKATEINPADGRPRMMRWRVLSDQGLESTANAEFASFERLGPKWIELVALQLSEFQIKHVEAKDAIQVLQDVQKTIPNSGKLHLYLGKAYLALADTDAEGRSTYLNLANSELTQAQLLLPQDQEVLTTRQELGKAQRSLP